MRSMVCPPDWSHHLLPSGELHQVCLGGGISSGTAKSRTDTYDWFGFGLFWVFDSCNNYMKGMNCGFCWKIKTLTKIGNIHKHKEGLEWRATFLYAISKGQLKSHPIGKAGSGMCNPVSHCTTSPCPSAVLAKGNQYSKLCHSRQAALGTALQGQELASSTTLLWDIHGRWIFSTTTIFLG